ncbi:exonuclease SbcCD subunit D [Geothrix sp. 21YS21S-4]|uniref:exonuclease SbcCD subunit D n=1 Tax=Geothrix sp. 21YS21S-4 TaxID=3068889 RepID=UPI0027B8AA16|nr:exonuclease SbcCD subunit D [Geothrix sp. 21YS21S-4]
MRFLHTSDWHLGKTLCNANLLEDQAHALDQVAAMVKEAGAEALVVAGDLYDRAVPPKDAVALLDEFLDRIVRGLGVPVLIIAGNHDSPERLGFASGFLGTQGLHVAGPLDADAAPVVIGGTAFHLLPYADPAMARHAFQAEGVRTHQDVLAAQLARARAVHPADHRFVAVAHAFVAGGEGSDSELGLAIGGTGEVDAGLFRECDYAALGHLHRPQQAGFAHVRYAGSLLKYSASEAGHAKSATLVELPERGPARTEILPFSPRRDLRRLRGRFDDLLRGPEGNADDYLFLELEDTGPVLDAMARLRRIYPNILGIQPAPRPTTPTETALSAAADRELDPALLFDAFFRGAAGRPMDEAERELFREVAGRNLSGEAPE